MKHDRVPSLEAGGPLSQGGGRECGGGTPWEVMRGSQENTRWTESSLEEKKEKGLQDARNRSRVNPG